jgi:hypothetical protein
MLSWLAYGDDPLASATLAGVWEKPPRVSSGAGDDRTEACHRAASGPHLVLAPAFDRLGTLG